MIQNKLLIPNTIFWEKYIHSIGVSKQTAHWTFLQNVPKKNFLFKDLIEIHKTLLDCFPWVFTHRVEIPFIQAIFGKNYSDTAFIPKEKAYDNATQYFESMIQKYNDIHSLWIDEDDPYLVATPIIIFNSLDFFNSETGKYFNVSNMSNTYDSSFNIFGGWNEKNKKTVIGIDLEIKGEPFYEYPWGVEYLNFYLPKEYVEHNRKLLRNSIKKLNENGFEVESLGFEWGDSHPNWAINNLGFIDKV